VPNQGSLLQKTSLLIFIFIAFGTHWCGME